LSFVVLGADGFVGSAILAKTRHQADALGLSVVPTPSQLAVDLRDPDQFDHAVLSADSTIVFTAAISSPDACAAHPEDSALINVVGTGRFIRRALDRGCRVIFFSSDVVFGGSAGAMDEFSPLCPAGAYGEQKAQIEERFTGEPGFKVVRPSLIVSMRDKFSAYLLDCARAGRCAEVYHPLRRSAIHLDDIVAAVDQLYDNWDDLPHSAVNLCGPRLISRLELAELVQRIGASGLRFTQVPLPEAFLRSRPATIEMQSRCLAQVLGRAPLELELALRNEFSQEN